MGWKDCKYSCTSCENTATALIASCADIFVWNKICYATLPSKKKDTWNLRQGIAKTESNCLVCHRKV